MKKFVELIFWENTFKNNKPHYIFIPSKLKTFLELNGFNILKITRSAL